jgi:hypothetical protein
VQVAEAVGFLAVAALAYVGAANAQTDEFSYFGTAIPDNSTAGVGDIANTLILTDGAWGADFSAGATTTGTPVTSTTAGSSLRVSDNGKYEFEAKTTDWATELGATWATDNLIGGSFLAFSGTGATFNFYDTPGTANDGASDAITTAEGTFDLQIQATNVTTSAVLTLNESILKDGFTNLTTDVISCGYAYELPLDVVANPVFSSMIIDKPAICQTIITEADALDATELTVTINLTANTHIDDLYIDATLQRVSGSASSATLSNFTFTNAIFSQSLTNSSNNLATIYFPIFKLAEAKDATDFDYSTTTDLNPGIYSFTLNTVTDNIQTYATNRADIDIDPASTVTFAILPAPKPTLTTTTIK